MANPIEEFERARKMNDVGALADGLIAMYRWMSNEFSRLDRAIKDVDREVKSIDREVKNIGHKVSNM